MADRKLTDVSTVINSTDSDFLILIQSNAVKKIALSNINTGLTEERVNQLIDAKLPRSAEEVQY